ncbi:MAG TPA: NUDIX domain-containing protein [Alphaproteobacteria bacterium]|nr:NUDIX domain-containing protein [Alphaproteobacteria bacterium]
MSSLTHTSIYTVLEQGDQIFLMRRANTGYLNGYYSLPAGHLEEGETLVDTAVREAHEEAGITINPANITFAHTLFYQGERTYTQFYFSCKTWQGQPHNAEPAKCDDAQWFDKNNLPEKTVPEVKQALHHIARGEKFSQLDVR